MGPASAPRSRSPTKLDSSSRDLACSFGRLAICIDMSDQGLTGMDYRVLVFDGIGQDFPSPGRRSQVRVLDDISFEAQRGKFIAVIGPSGCGKSTLLQMAAGLLFPTR